MNLTKKLNSLEVTLTQVEKYVCILCLQKSYFFFHHW